MIKIPPYLKKGDTIAIVCPAGFMPLEKVARCASTLREWGYQVRIGKTLESGSPNYFSGTDDERLADLQSVMDDPAVNAILCGRGGYGTGRIIDRIDFSRFKKSPKWIIGFSDITVLHLHLFTTYKIASLHAPMAAAFDVDSHDNIYIDSLRRALQGRSASYSCAAHALNNRGEGRGELVGGNLALYTHLIGTPSDSKTKGKILFLEDIGEYLYNVDRMFYQIKRSGKLDKLAGLIIGGFSDMKDTDRPFGETVYDIIHQLVKEYDYPICYNFPVSHEKENLALMVGIEYQLKVGRSKVTLEE